MHTVTQYDLNYKIILLSEIMQTKGNTNYIRGCEQKESWKIEVVTYIHAKQYFRFAVGFLFSGDC